MSLNAALFHYLSQHALLQPLVGTHIYPREAPQQAQLPYIVYTRLSYQGVRHFKGASGLAQAQYQWDIYATTPQQSETIAEAMRLALDGFRGTWDGVHIRTCNLDNMIDGLEDNQDGGQDNYSRIALDTTIWFLRDVTTFTYA